MAMGMVVRSLRHKLAWGLSGDVGGCRSNIAAAFVEGVRRGPCVRALGSIVEINFKK